MRLKNKIRQLRFRLAYWLMPSLIQNAHEMAMAVQPYDDKPELFIRDSAAYRRAWKRVVGWTYHLRIEDKS